MSARVPARIPSSPKSPESLREGYSALVVEHFERPRNVGGLDPVAPDVGSTLVGAPEHGVIRLDLRIQAGVIQAARFKAMGCGVAIACSSFVAERLEGQPLAAAQALTRVDIVRALALPPVKIHCAVLAERAIQGAISDYQRKQAPSAAGEAPPPVRPA